jgi:conjugative relaxase-like TrwC/TraI family protein
MLMISRAISAAKLRAYHAEAFSNARDNYFTTGDRITGRWHGELARRWGLVGDVQEEPFLRLTEGQDPTTGETLVRHVTPRLYVNSHGATVHTMAHRAGWDATFSTPKSISLTALVGGDERVRVAHRESVAVALEELERHVQARSGGNREPETTRNWAAAVFEHDSARPVAGYAAPHLHTHVVFFNLTRARAGKIRSLQARELYRTQRYDTAVYLSELARRLALLGYEVERSAIGQPEIRGYTLEYLKVSSARSRQIADDIARREPRGTPSVDIAAYRTREPKVACSRDEMLWRHRHFAAAFGDQPARVVYAARERASELERGEPHQRSESVLTHRSASARASAKSAVTWALDRHLARNASADERALMGEALTRSMGALTLEEVRAECERRIRSGELVSVPRRGSATSRAFATAEIVALERETVGMMRAGQRALPGYGHSLWEIHDRHPDLDPGTCATVSRVLGSRDRIMAFESEAGSKKASALEAVRGEAEAAGYQVTDLRQTSRATRVLEAARLLVAKRRFYVVEEWRLDDARQMHDFLRALGPHDRLLLLGNPRRFEAVEGGRPYVRLLAGGMQAVRLDVMEEAIDGRGTRQLKSAIERPARAVARALQPGPAAQASNARRAGLEHALGIEP